jgi:diacylglycerol kinase (ATP)
VLSAEAVNTAVEALADKLSPEPDPLIKRAKDVAAGAVLIVAIAALIIGIIIFLPKLWALFW